MHAVWASPQRDVGPCRAHKRGSVLGRDWGSQKTRIANARREEQASSEMGGRVFGKGMDAGDVAGDAGDAGPITSSAWNLH